MRKIEILSNTTYGEFTTVSSERTRGGIVWICTTTQGKLRRLVPSELNKYIPNEEKKRLLLLSNEQLLENNLHQMGVRRQIFYEYQLNSKKRGIEFHLQFEEFNNLIMKDCYYSGDKPIVSERWLKRMHKTQPPLKANGIDRLDSSKGYIVENCVPCCAKCNMMKGTLSVEEFLSQIEKIYNRKSSTTIPKGSTL